MNESSLVTALQAKLRCQKFQYMLNPNSGCLAKEKMELMENSTLIPQLYFSLAEKWFPSKLKGHLMQLCGLWESKS